MAKSSNETEVEIGSEEEAPRRGARSHMEKHEAFVEWYADNYGVDLATVTPAQVIAAFAAKRNEFRRSDSYQNNWSKDQLAARRAERDAAREEARAAKEAERAQRKAEKEAEKAKASTEGDGEAKPKRGRGRSRKTAEPTVEVDATDEATEASEDEIFA